MENPSLEITSCGNAMLLNLSINLPIMQWFINNNNACNNNNYKPLSYYVAKHFFYIHAVSSISLNRMGFPIQSFPLHPPTQGVGLDVNCLLLLFITKIGMHQQILVIVRTSNSVKICLSFFKLLQAYCR